MCLFSLQPFNMKGNQRENTEKRFKNTVVSKRIYKSQCTYLEGCCSALVALRSSTIKVHKFGEGSPGISKQQPAFVLLRKPRALLQIAPRQVKRFISRQQTPGGRVRYGASSSHNACFYSLNTRRNPQCLHYMANTTWGKTTKNQTAT